MSTNESQISSTWFYFVLGSLVAYRLSLLTSKESGPARIFKKLRRLPPPHSSTREGLSCLWCSSMYSSALVTGYYVWRGIVSGWDAPLWWLSCSAAAIAINQMFTKGD